MNILNISFRAIARATEDGEKVELALRFVCGAGEVNKTNVAGHFGNSMVLMNAMLNKKKDIRAFMNRITEAGIVERLAGEARERVDDECVFHFRLDKQKAYEEVMALAETKDVIDCNVKIGAYPAKKDNAVASLDNIFQELLKL